MQWAAFVWLASSVDMHQCGNASTSILVVVGMLITG